ncbi:MAG: hypothetical protein JWO73_252 [Candidatus Taylorbacteria bacterium]|nr:hypothetical protein [Candidatus Taylorbacteria bacterium]
MKNENKKQDMGGEGKKANPIQIQTFLKGVDYPADRTDLIDAAEAQEAPKEVLGALMQVPEREYKSPADLEKEIGKLM